MHCAILHSIISGHLLVANTAIASQAPTVKSVPANAKATYQPVILQEQSVTEQLVPLINPQLGQIDNSKPIEDFAKPDKSQYNLFNPTPKNLLRKFTSDRPGVTNNPFTIDAGHLQFETYFVDYTRKSRDENGNTTENFLFVPTYFRLGLLNNVDFELLFQPYEVDRTRLSNTKTNENSGLSNLEADVKINIYGNDTYGKPGSTALGIMSFVDIPTVNNGLGNSSIEGGLGFPFEIKLSKKTSLGLMTEFDINKNNANNGYHLKYINSASLGYDLTNTLGSYAEISTQVGNESKYGKAVTFDTGLSLNLGKNAQIYSGINIGLTRAANDVDVYIGLSKRF